MPSYFSLEFLPKYGLLCSSSTFRLDCCCLLFVFDRWYHTIERGGACDSRWCESEKIRKVRLITERMDDSRHCGRLLAFFILPYT